MRKRNGFVFALGLILTWIVDPVPKTARGERREKREERGESREERGARQEKRGEEERAETGKRGERTSGAPGLALHATGSSSIQRFHLVLNQIKSEVGG